MATYKSNIAENRAIHASAERGMAVPLYGSMRPLHPGLMQSPKVGKVAPPHGPAGLKEPRRSMRKYYGQ